MAKSIALSVDHVFKDFRLPHQKVTTMKRAILELVTSRSRHIELQHALQDVTFEVEKGEFFGIVGRNGSGKSTLLKILAGIYQPNRGHVTVQGRVVPFIELGVGFNGELTGRENVFLNGALLGFSVSEIKAMYQDIVEFAELGQFMDQKLKNYSSGMQVRLAFSLATRAQADVLLVDEVLAVGDADFQRKCYDYFKSLKKAGTTVVFVTHDMNAVREYCDRAILIDDSRLAAAGSAEDIAQAYTKLFAAAEDSEEQLSQPTHTGQRWGDGDIMYDRAKLTFEAHDQLKLVARAEAKANVSGPVFGFSIHAADGQAVFGSNTLNKKLKSRNVKTGQFITLEWTLPNILADGTYTITVTAHDVTGSKVYDWYDDALEFQVRNDEKVPYYVNPPMSVTMDIS
jgi:ABC-2 type transport system ATP-binding protein